MNLSGLRADQFQNLEGREYDRGQEGMRLRLDQIRALTAPEMALVVSDPIIGHERERVVGRYHVTMRVHPFCRGEVAFFLAPSNRTKTGADNSLLVSIQSVRIVIGYSCRLMTQPYFFLFSVRGGALGRSVDITTALSIESVEGEG